MNKIITIDGDKVSRQDVLDSKKNIELLYIPGFLKSETTWEEIISHANFLKKNPDLTLPSPVKVIGGLQLWSDFFHAGYFLDNSKAFSQLDKIKEKTTLLYGREPDNGCTLVNFVGDEQMIPIHGDRRDSFYWQAINTVEWRIYENENEDSIYQSLMVKAGDALFVPTGIVHSVFCAEPRAAFSIFYDKKN